MVSLENWLLDVLNSCKWRNLVQGFGHCFAPFRPRQRG